MKKFLYSICVLACVCSCGTIKNDEADLNTVITEITFSGEKPELDGSAKTIYSGGKILWSAGDNISATYKTADGWVGKVYKSISNAKFSADYVSAQFVISSSFEQLGAESSAEFYCYYPKDQVTTGSGVSGDSVPVTIPSEQTPTATSFDKSADFLLGKSGSVTVPASTSFSSLDVNITWERLVAHGYLTFTGLDNAGFTSGEQIQSVKITADKNLAGTFTLNSESGVLTAKSAVKTITVKGTNLALDGDNNLNVWFCSLPFDPTTLTFEIFTDKAYYVKSFADITGKKFEQNMRNVLSVSMASANRTEKLTFTRLSEVTVGGTYLILNEGKSKVFNGAATSNALDLDGSLSTLNNGILTTYENLSSYYLQITSAGDSNYYIKHGSDYIGWTGNTGNSSADMHVSSTKYTNTISISDGVATVTSNPTGSNTAHGVLNYVTKFKYTADATSNVAIYQLQQ